MRRLVHGGTTLVFVTHDLDQMQSICGRAIVLEQGRVAHEGPARDAVGHYMTAMSRAFADRPADLHADDDGQGDTVELLDLRWFDAENEEVVWVRPRQEIRAELTLRLVRPVRSLVVELNMRAATNEPLLSLNSGRAGRVFGGDAGAHRIGLRLPEIPLSGGQYFWNVRVWDAENGTILLDAPFRFPMVINDGGRGTGALCLDHEWSFDPIEAATAASRGDGPDSGVLVSAGGTREDLPVR
jgi:hypothetical protein